jgi:hypothetical protein
MTGADPREDKEATEKRDDEVLDGLEEEGRRVGSPDEACDPPLGDSGSEIERGRSG